ncbi:MAG: DNA-3-methyladenine glycosylase 2 family protein [Actinobacteria bacterium]|nr:DNA-3-methyladenine glycosylase 2 family protein [Actinomycetota bacterium]
MAGDDVVERRFRPRLPVDLRLSLGPSARPLTTLVGPGEVWRATRTPAGPATVRLSAAGGEVVVRAWGPGAAWAAQTAPELVGAGDDVEGFQPRHPLVAELHRRLPGLRIVRTQAVFEALVPTILEQKVVALEARRAYAGLVRRYGSTPPGPAGVVPAKLRLLPAPEAVAGLPSYAFHPLGVERKRADTVRLAARHARRLQEAAALSPAEGRRRLQVLPGIGPWSAAEVAIVALGDADAVSVGDYHLPHLVSWCLAGEPRGCDERMLELLEPFRGHRGRVLRLLEASGMTAPRYGPRMPLRNIAAS